MTIELKNLEYSFAFFYFNPSFCEAQTPSTSVDESLEFPDFMDDGDLDDGIDEDVGDFVDDDEDDENRIKAANISKVSSYLNDVGVISSWPLKIEKIETSSTSSSLLTFSSLE